MGRPLALGLHRADLPPHTTAELDAEMPVRFRLRELALDAPPGTVVLDLCFRGEPWLSLEMTNASDGIPAVLFPAGADFFSRIRTAPIPRVEVGEHITLKVRTGAKGGEIIGALIGDAL